MSVQDHICNMRSKFCLCGKSRSFSPSLHGGYKSGDHHSSACLREAVGAQFRCSLIDDIYDQARLSDPKSTPSKPTVPVCPKAASAATSHPSAPFLYSLPKILTTQQGPFKTGLLIHESGCQETSGSASF